MSFSKLPFDLLVYCILPNVRQKDRLRIGLVSKLLYKYSRHKSLWRSIKLNRKVNNDDLGKLKEIGLINKEVYFNENTNITDDGLKHLETVHLLEFNYKSRYGKKIEIGDNGLKYLKNIKKLKIICKENITDNGLEHLRGIHTLDLWGNQKITDNGLKYIKDTAKSVYVNQKKVI